MCSSNNTFTEGAGSLAMGKIDEPLDLRDRETGEAFTNVIEAIAEIVAVHDRIGQNASSSHHRAPGHFAMDPFDQFTGRPIDI